MANKVTAPETRFWEKVDKNGKLILDTPCWEWTASKFSNGYGQFFDGINKIGAHRFSTFFILETFLPKSWCAINATIEVVLIRDTFS